MSVNAFMYQSYLAPADTTLGSTKVRKGTSTSSRLPTKLLDYKSHRGVALTELWYEKFGLIK